MNPAPAAPVWRATAAGAWLWASPEWSRLTGQPAGESLGQGWLAMIVADDRPQVEAAWREAAGRQAMAVHARVATPRGPRWMLHRATPQAANDWLGLSLDVDDTIAGDARHAALLTELQHRGRNALSTIRSIIRHSVTDDPAVADFAAHLDGRLGALARAQAVLTRDLERPADLRALIIDELAAVATREGERLTLEGPEVAIASRAIQPVVLAIHELATNAIKFGALAGREGHIAINWGRRPAACGGGLDLVWRETVSGAAPLLPDPRRGFGLEFLEHGLAYELDAGTRVRFGDSGLDCTITIPATALAPKLRASLS